MQYMKALELSMQYNFLKCLKRIQYCIVCTHMCLIHSYELDNLQENNSHSWNLMLHIQINKWCIMLELSIINSSA